MLQRMLWMGLLLGVGACSKPSNPVTDAGVVISAETSPAPEDTLNAQSLSPRLEVVGLAEGAPVRLELRLAKAVVAPDAVGKEAKGVAATLAPDLKGRWEWADPSTLAFIPAAGFPFDTPFALKVAEIPTRLGTRQAPSGPSWAYEFRTPKFAFVRATPVMLNLEKGQLDVQLLFSGKVTTAAVQPHVTFTVDGAQASQVKWTSEAEGLAVRASVRHKLTSKSAVTFKLRAGVRAVAGGVLESSAEDTVPLFGGKPVAIRRVVLQEGTTGFYWDVLCNDDAAPDARYPHYWDSITHNSYRLSSRCTPAEEALSLIRVSPKVPLSLSPTERGFRILGTFARGTYQLTLQAGLPTIDGGTLRETFQQTFRVPSRSPKINFVSAGRYLPRAAWRNLGFRHLNLSEVELTVRQVPPENLVFWLSDDGTEKANERSSNVIANKKLPVRGQEDQETTSWIDVASLLPGPPSGVLELTLTGTGISRPVASRLVLTDIALVAKKSVRGNAPADNGEVWVWALDAQTGAPLSDVEVSSVRKSGKVLDRCTPRAEKGCALNASPKDVDPSPAFALIARRQNEVTYLRYADLEIDLAESDVGGVAWKDVPPYRAFLFTDRGVYRPGETAHWVAIVRDEQNQAPKIGMPVVITVKDPRSKEMLRRQLTVNEAGVVTLDVPFADFANTGAYVASVQVADRVLATQSINVEEFVPERLKVHVQPKQPALFVHEPASFAIQATYLFGGVPQGSSVELTCSLERTVFTPKNHGNYQYGVVDLHKLTVPALPAVRGTLDNEGKRELSCPALAENPPLSGTWRMVGRVGVLEAGSGRASVAEASTVLHPDRLYIGLRADRSEVKSGESVTVEGLVVDWEGNAQEGSSSDVEVQTLEVFSESGWWWDEDEGGERRQERFRTVAGPVQKWVGKNGRFQLQFTAQQSDWSWRGYIVRARMGNALTELRIHASAQSGWWEGEEGRGQDRTPKPMKPTPLALTGPEQTRINEPFTVTVKVPFKGRMLFSVEADRLLASEWKSVSPGDVTFRYTPAAFVPNLYVSALLIKDPHLESAEAYLPDRAFGVVSIPMDPVELRQTVKLSVPAEVKSGGELSIQLELGQPEAGTVATVAVIDEGVLQLTKFKTPEPLRGLFPRRELGVRTFETIGWSLLIPPQGPQTKTGGDGEGSGGAGRVQPVKPVALWSGLVRVPADGKLDLKLQLPTYRGAVRVMAVVAGPRRIGAAQATVTVKDPLVLMTTLPRFITQGDVVEIPVFVTNLSGKTQNVQVSLTSEDAPVPGLEAMSKTTPLTLLGKSQGVLSLPHGESGTAVFRAKADKAIGAAMLKVLARAGGLESSESLWVPFSPAGVRERRIHSQELQSSTVDLKPLLQGWLPTTEKTTVWVTTNPYGESFSHLNALLHYPYGCIEQTTSTTRPLLYVSGLIGEIAPELTANNKIEDMAMSGIARILSMQTPAGGFGYWPGDDEPTAWGTAYATHLLLDAQKAGYPVPANRVEDAVSWMEKQVDARSVWTGYGGARNAEAYTHYVLSIAGKGRKAQIQTLLDKDTETAETTNGEVLETRYMLKAALYQSGDRRYEKDLKAPPLAPVTDVRSNGWSFYSDRRARGFMLSAFTDLFGQDPAGEPLARLVAASLQGHTSGWYTTQELVWGITGLGKRLQGAASALPAPVLMANGKAVKAVPSLPRATGKSFALVRASELSTLSLQLEGWGQGKGRVFLIVSSEGIPIQPKAQYGGEGVQVSRVLRTVEGELLDPQAARTLGETLVVEVKVKNTGHERVQNLALVTRLPAGWEIENPRLGRGGNLSWLSEDRLWKPDSLNLRDDRVEVFGALPVNQELSFIYTVRAVTSGIFALPPVELEAMYDPRIWARERGTTVRVQGPWADFLL